MNAETPAARLVRGLGLWMAVAIVVGTVIGSGIFKKPRQVAEHVPESAAMIVWVLGGVLALLGALAYAEVSVLYPKSGGNYVFLREGYGRLAGFLWGWVEFWMIRAGSLAALATIFAESVHDILRNDAFQQTIGLTHLGTNPLGFWPQRWLTVAIIGGLALVNVRGVKWGGVLQLLITLVKIGSLVGIIVLPFVIHANFSPGSPISQTAAPLPAAVTAGGFLSALLATLWAYHGWMNLAPVAEEVKDPQRNLPLALLGGVGIIILLYLGTNWAYQRVIPREEMAQMKDLSPAAVVEFRALHGAAAPLPDKTVAIGFAHRLLGPIGAAVAAAAVMFSVFGALNGNLLVGPRLLYAMAEDGLAPRALARVHERFSTPANAIIVLAAWAAGLIIGVALLTEYGPLSPDKPHFDHLTDFAMFGATIFETLAVATIFVFRQREPGAHRSFRCPGYPLVPIVFVAIHVAVVVNIFVSDTITALIGLGFMAVGWLIYTAFLSAAPPGESAAPTDA